MGETVSNTDLITLDSQSVMGDNNPLWLSVHNFNLK